jgi:hypothetical protein
LKAKNRLWLGHLSTLLGVVLMANGLYFCGEHEERLPAAQKTLIAGASTLGGGLLSFGVGRRLLTAREEEAPGGNRPDAS